VDGNCRKHGKVFTKKTMTNGSSEKKQRAQIAILSTVFFFFVPIFAFATTYNFGKEFPQTFETFTASFVGTSTINVSQELPSSISGSFGSFVFVTDSATMNPSAYCFIEENAPLTYYYDTSPTGNGTGQQICDFSGSFNPAKTYRFGVTGYSGKIYGSNSTTTILSPGYLGSWVQNDLDLTCLSQHYSGSNDHCDNLNSLNITFDSIGSSTPFFGSGVISSMGIEPECGISDISACFTNALSWAFYPNPNSFDKFSTLADQLKDRAPFGYFTSGKNALLGLNATSSTPAYTLATSSPIMATIFTPLRTGLTWVFLFGGVVWIYKRVTHVNV